ncbi:nuA3 HAT complex component nto1 [Lobulomyces angularis]|nr:nuA3 HAT complex component nto1 [Lobulomyces angularis]
MSIISLSLPISPPTKPEISYQPKIRGRKQNRKASKSSYQSDVNDVKSNNNIPLEERSLNEIIPDIDLKYKLPVLTEWGFPDSDKEKTENTADGISSNYETPADSTSSSPISSNASTSIKKPINETESSTCLISRVNQYEGINPPLKDKLTPLSYITSKEVPKAQFKKIIETVVENEVDDDTYSRHSSRHNSRNSSLVPVSSHYIHYFEPGIYELAERIEYDMDEQDSAWLKRFNEKRKKDCEKPITELFFEMVIDRLEKEWFSLKKEVSKLEKVQTDLPEESICSICDDGECENANAIVFCDGCNLAVHQDCYGVPLIPEGQWLCRKCMLSPGKPLNCIFCPIQKGAFKQTVSNTWAHSLCALWIPEVCVSNPIYMEPVDCVDKIPKGRWKLVCYICKKRMGCAIQCSSKLCYTPYHATCARLAKFYMKIQPVDDHVEMTSYCDKHTPKDYLAEKGYDAEKNLIYAQKKIHKEFLKKKTDFASSQLSFDNFQNSSTISNSLSPSKLRNSHLNTLNEDDASSETRLNPVHVIPHYIYTKVLSYTAKGSQKVSKRPLVIQEICKYWSLKRDAGKGAPLLKRLHIEPWTTTATISSIDSDDFEEMQRRHNVAKLLRIDLEKIRLHAELVRKREKLKLKSLNFLRLYLEKLKSPLKYSFKEIISELRKQDKELTFHTPVPVQIAPDYYEVVKSPMDLSTLEKNVDNHVYITVEEFQNDVNLMFDNCKLYNASATAYHKQAIRMQAVADDLIKDLKLTHLYKSLSAAGVLPFDIDPVIFQYYYPNNYVPRKFKYYKDPTSLEEVVEDKVFELAVTEVAEEISEVEKVSVSNRTREKVLNQNEKRKTRSFGAVENVVSPENNVATSVRRGRSRFQEISLPAKDTINLNKLNKFLLAPNVPKKVSGRINVVETVSSKEQLTEDPKSQKNFNKQQSASLPNEKRFNATIEVENTRIRKVIDYRKEKIISPVTISKPTYSVFSNSVKKSLTKFATANQNSKSKLLNNFETSDIFSAEFFKGKNIVKEESLIYFEDCLELKEIVSSRKLDSNSESEKNNFAEEFIRKRKRKNLNSNFKGFATLNRPVSQIQIKNNATVFNYTLSVIIAFVGLTYAAVPLYQLLCTNTGLDGTPLTAPGHKFDKNDMKPVSNHRKLTIHFDSSTSDSMRWNFKPITRQLTLVPGETALAFYTAENLDDNDIVGISTYSVVPAKCAQYFNKIQCFCFEEQLLLKGEQVDMPVFFYIDPEFAYDPWMKDVKDITLSYTFFKSKTQAI